MSLLPAAVRARRHDDLFLIQLHDPSGQPRLTRPIIAELLRQIIFLRDAADLRAAVLTGTQKCFAAGADLVEVGALTAVEAIGFAELGQSLMHAIEACRKSVVAAIRGYCLGGGLDLALACHVRVAAHDAFFAHPGAGLGILTGWGGTQRLPRLLLPGARARALELLATGQRLTAEEAYRWGLVHRVVPPNELLSAAMVLASSKAPST